MDVTEDRTGFVTESSILFFVSVLVLRDATVDADTALSLDSWMDLILKMSSHSLQSCIIVHSLGFLSQFSYECVMCVCVECVCGGCVECVGLRVCPDCDAVACKHALAYLDLITDVLILL